MRPAHLDRTSKWHLSPRQVEVVELMARGRTNGEIAAWHSGRRYRWRWVEALAIAGLGKAVAASALAVVAGSVAAAVLVGTRGDDGGSQPALPDPTASPSPGTLTPSARSSPSATPTATSNVTPIVPPCQSTDFETALLVEQVDVEVRVVVAVSGTKLCSLSGELKLDTLFPPTDPGPRMPRQLLARTYAIAVEFPFSGEIGEWRWVNWCGEAVEMPWVVGIEPPFGTVASVLQPGALPGCSDPGSPTLLRDVTIAPELGGEELDPRCAEGVEEWTCQFAAMLLDHIVAGRDMFDIVRRGHPQYIARCDEPWPPDSGEVKLCRGARPGEIREGFPLALHGSQGDVLAPLAMAERLEDAFDNARSLRAATIGVGFDDPAATRFIIAFATGGVPAAVYLMFEHVEGNESAFIGAGLSGDNAETIIGGGVTLTDLGETGFRPLRLLP
jgi:hypothetical protein